MPVTVLLDVGNTSVTHGMYHGGRFSRFGSLQLADIPNFVSVCSKSGGNDPVNVVISSVVPDSTQFLKRKLSARRGLRVRVVGSDIPLRIKHKYKNYNKLGMDRVVNAYGAARIYKTPIVVFDFGTALTADYISARGVFEGGLIIPGPQLSFQALLSRAARLPSRARLPRKSAGLTGRTTMDCLSSGIIEGYGAMTDGLIDRFKARYGRKVRSLLTGGFAVDLKKHVRNADIVDPMHSVKSLLLIHKDFS